MKVLHLGKFDGDVGGIERHLRALLGGMPPEIEVVNLVANAHAFTDEHRDNGYTTVRVANHGSLASVALAPAMPSVARRLHRQHRFDIVHLHFPDPLGHLTTLTLPRSVRRVISWHSDIVKQQWALAFYAPFLRPFVQSADALIGATPQHFSTSTQIPQAHEQQLREVIPYGIDGAGFASSDESRLERKQLLLERGSRGLIFTVGRHVYYKGFDTLIRAMQTIDGDLWIGGRGPLTNSLKQLAIDMGVAHKVRFLGFIPDQLLPAYYEACDVFCMPSVERAEQFGLVQLEAMACGKPVVTTRLGTGVEFVTLDGVTGLLVPPKDVDALASALRRLLDDNELRTCMGSAGKQRVEQVFSLEQMIRKTVDVYHRVLASTPAVRHAG
ncbi:MAG: glycosyltransferase [Burkholderiaceae bacterium]|nr:glycosyltransferase [Burkholderiaceae bacterium]